MSTQIGSISTTSATSTATTTSPAAVAPPLTDATRQQLQALGVDTTAITTEAQGQIALLQAQQQQPQQAQGGDKHHSGGGKAEMQAMKSEATELASKLGISVAQDEKLDDIMAAIAPALQAKASAAGNDQAKLAEVQELQSEYDTLSSSLTSMQSQHQQGAQNGQSGQGGQGTQALTSTLNNMATQNKVYHQV